MTEDKFDRMLDRMDRKGGLIVIGSLSMALLWFVLVCALAVLGIVWLWRHR